MSKAQNHRIGFALFLKGSEVRKFDKVARQMFPFASSPQKGNRGRLLEHLIRKYVLDSDTDNDE